MDNSQVVQGIIRHALTAVGGFFVAKGIVSESGMQEVVGSAMALIGVIWSVSSKKK